MIIIKKWKDNALGKERQLEKKGREVYVNEGNIVDAWLQQFSKRLNLRNVVGNDYFLLGRNFIYVTVAFHIQLRNHTFIFLCLLT